MIKNEKIYAVDFDGTLSKNSKWPEIGDANNELFDFLIKKKNDGNYIILWTCRCEKESEEAVEFCKENGLEFDAVNDNMPHISELFGSNTRKIYADYYIDDKNYDPIEKRNKWRETMRKRLKGER